MKSFKDAMQLGTDINNLCNMTFLKDDPDDMTFSFSIEDNGGACGDGYSVVFSWCVVDLGWMVDTSTLTGNEQAPGFRVWVGVMKSGGHWEPDYMDDVSRCETVSRTEAIRCVLEEYISWRMEQMRWSDYAAEFNQEEV